MARPEPRTLASLEAMPGSAGVRRIRRLIPKDQGNAARIQDYFTFPLQEITKSLAPIAIEPDAHNMDIL